MDNFRATGRTFRMVLEAVLQCSRGKKVIIGVHNRNYIGDIVQRCAGIIGGAYIQSDGYYVKAKQGIVGIEGAGHIVVMTNRMLDNTIAENPKCLSEHVIMRDHYQPDMDVHYSRSTGVK